jgi:hypothetical protein
LAIFCRQRIFFIDTDTKKVLPSEDVTMTMTAVGAKIIIIPIKNPTQQSDHDITDYHFEHVPSPIIDPTIPSDGRVRQCQQCDTGLTAVKDDDVPSNSIFKQ